MSEKLDSYGLTDLGQVCDANTDQFLIADCNKSLLIRHTSLGTDDPGHGLASCQGHMLLVAEGAGGTASAKRAATRALNTLAEAVLNTGSSSLQPGEQEEEEMQTDLRTAVQRCRERLEGSRDGTARTALTMAYILYPRLYVVHSGDSRCYRLREGKLEQLTLDHTLIPHLVPHTKTSDVSSTHQLWNCFGEDNCERPTDVSRSVLAQGDTLLLCSDGLTACVPDERIATLLGGNERLPDICRHLIEAANEAGGPDNITVVVARIGPFRQHPQPMRETTAAAERYSQNRTVPRPLSIHGPAHGGQRLAPPVPCYVR